MISNNALTTFRTSFAAIIAAFTTLTGFSVLSPQQSSAQSQIVQLPVVRQFTYRGAVKVPDGGTTLLGGVTRSASGANSAGVPLLGGIPGVGRGFRNRGIGSETNSAKAAVHVKILVMEELEAQMLAEARANGTIGEVDAVNEAIRQKAAFLTKHVGRKSDNQGSLDHRQ